MAVAIRSTLILKFYLKFWGLPPPNSQRDHTQEPSQSEAANKQACHVNWHQTNCSGDLCWRVRCCLFLGICRGDRVAIHVRVTHSRWFGAGHVAPFFTDLPRTHSRAQSSHAVDCDVCISTCCAHIGRRHAHQQPPAHSFTHPLIAHNPWTPMTDSCVHVPVQSVSCRWECLLFPAMCMWAPFENEVGVRISASPFKHIVITCFEYKCTYLCWHRRWLRPLWRTSLKQIRVHIESTFEMNLRDIRVIAVSRLREIHITVIAIVLEWW